MNAILKWASAISCALILGACQPQATQSAVTGFKNTDITGAAFAQSLNLQDPQGRFVTLDSFKGKVTLVFFGFTSCPDVCPTALTRALEVRKLLGAQADKLQVVFITVDPERDTGPVLAEYVKAFDPSFLALRGTLPEIETTAREFRVFFAKVPTQSSYTMDHTALSYVFDTDAKVRLAVNAAAPAKDIADDVQALLRR